MAFSNCPNPEHNLATQHRIDTQHIVVCPQGEGIPWPGELRTRPYCLDCGWPDNPRSASRMKPETKKYIRKTCISGFVIGLVMYVIFGLMDSAGSKWSLHVFIWDIFSMCLAIVIVDWLKGQEIFLRKK